MMLEKIAIIILVNLLLYFRTLSFKFVSDDFTVFHQPPAFKNAWHKRWLQFIGACKLKGPTFSFVWHKGLKMAILKTEEQEHLLALLIHIAICVSMFFAFGANHISFVCSLLYSCNPVNNQATIWPGGRGYALPILSLLLSMAIPLLSPVLIYFGMWFTIGFHGIPLALIGSSSWYLLPVALICLLIHRKKFTKAIKLKSSMESFAQDKKYDFGKFVIFIKTYGFYLTLCLIPFRITFYHSFLPSMAGSQKERWLSIWDKFFWFGLIGIVGTITFACLHWGPLAWGLLAFMLTIAPFCNVIRANQEIAERFAALPNVFLMYALANLIGIYLAIVTAFLAFYATRTFYTIGLYRDEYFITEFAIIEDRHAWWAWHCRAMKRWDTQSYKEALILWVMAKLISPKEFKVLINIATCLRLLKNDVEANQYLLLAEQNIVEGQEEEAKRFIEDHKRGKLPILL